MATYFANSEFTSAQIVVIGIPLDRTSSFFPGTRFGPEVGRIGTDNIESFSPYQKKDLTGVRIYDAGDLALTFETPQTPVELIKKTTRSNYLAGKKQVAIGGEHTITPLIIAELIETFPDLCVIQFDAHSDLREEFLGEPISHATAMRRVLDFIPRERLFQLGIRSFSSPAELSLPNLYPFETMVPIDEVRAKIGQRPLYITLDIDVLDPGVMPDVSTPQPGGCSYSELVRALAGLTGLNIIGCDLVEFCPRSLSATAGAATVAELVRELILLIPGQF
ncbi:MAG: agmatinase [bacterium]